MRAALRPLRIPVLGSLLSILLLLTSSSVTVAYNASSAVIYADNWSNNCNRSSCTKLRNTGPPRNYVDYGSQDCANFISQALYAGGLSEVGLGQTISDPKNWYWDPVYRIHSTSWTTTIGLRNHAYEYLGNRFDAKLYFYLLQPGDFILMDLVMPYDQDGPTHGMFWVGNGYDAEGHGWGPLVDQHSNERHHILYDWNWNPIFHDVWKIHVR